MNKQEGSILVALLLASIAFITIGLALISGGIVQFGNANKISHNANALLTAEAGIEQSLHNLNESSAFTGYPTEQVFFNDPVQGRGTYTTTIANASGSNSKTITSVARVYRHNKTTDPLSTRRVKVTVVGTTSAGYSVHTGPGGLILGGSANITNSDVYVNGFIDMKGSARIGTNSKPLSVNVANQQCPTGNNPGATYPTVCTNGTQPITLSGSAEIYGTVCATGQNPNSRIKKGSTGQGLVAGCTAPSVSTPTYDRAAHLAAVTTTATSTNNLYTCASDPNGSRNWTPNLRLNGNVSIGGNCRTYVKGNVYITGNLDIGGSSRMYADASVGGERPTVIVDGKITVGGSGQIIANSQGTGIRFISYKSTAACGPNCTSLSGNDLKTSQALETVNVGGSANLPGMIFQAYWGKLSLNGSGNIGSVIGQTVDMTGSGTVTFGTTLSSGDTTWTVSSYQQNNK